MTLRAGEVERFGIIVTPSPNDVAPADRRAALRMASAQAHHWATAELKARHRDEYRDLAQRERTRRGLPAESSQAAQLQTALLRVRELEARLAESKPEEAS